MNKDDDIREIGSEFWKVPTKEEPSELFPEDTQWFLSGRSALASIIDSIPDAHTVSIPSWCCSSMIVPFLRNGYEVRFYPVYWDHGLVQEIDESSDVLYLMDYFGYTSLVSISHPCVIRDVTHSVFSYPYTDTGYFFGSLRKWCGVWTGGYAWTRNGQPLPVSSGNDNGYTSLREKAMRMKRQYIHNSALDNGKNASDKAYLKVFEEAEELLEVCASLPAAERDIRLMRKLDDGFIRERRRANAEILMEEFRSWTIFPDIEDTNCPMFVPVFVPDGKRDALRKYLIQHEIYCPVHWPVSELHRLEKRELSLYQNELSLVCDQRYTEKDMARIVDTIHAFWKEGYKHVDSSEYRSE